MLDKKTFAIGVLSLSAVILLAANLLAPRPAAATYETIQDNSYAMVTGTAVSGGDVLYVTEKRSGIMVAFVYDPNRKAIVNKDRMAIQNVFAKALAAGGVRPR